MENNVLSVAHLKVTFSENCTGENKKKVDPKKALAQLFIDDFTEFFKGKEGKEFDESKLLKPTYPENKYRLNHIFYQEPDYQQARFRFLYIQDDVKLDRSIRKFDQDKFGMIYFNLDMSGEDPSLDVFSMSMFSTKEIFKHMDDVFVEMVNKHLGDMGYNIQLVRETEKKELDIMTIETMITQPGPIMEKIEREKIANEKIEREKIAQYLN